jgi:acetyl-CoA acetyltransferase family protein
MRGKSALASGRLVKEIISVDVPGLKGETRRLEHDEHPRADTTLEKLAKLPTPFRAGGTVTAGNASGVNDGAAAMLVASAEAVGRHGLKPIARVLGAAAAGVEPRIMGFGPAPASRKLLARLGLELAQMDVIELNEAFASQVLAVTRDLGLSDDAEHLNPNGGAIALGHPLGMSGARLVATAAHELQVRQGRYALCSMCIGVGQGIALILERI